MQIQKSTIDPVSHWKNILWVATLGVGFSSLVRIGLIIANFTDFRGHFGGAALALLLGWLFDLSMLSFALNPLMFIPPLLSALGTKTSKVQALYKYSFLSILVFLLSLFIFLSMSEFVFWEEFHSRFNFIAVDYLIYTHEVIHNLWESYPIVWIVLSSAAFALIFTWWLKKVLKFTLVEVPRYQGLLKSLVPGVLIVGLASLCSLSGLEELVISNQSDQEIAKNGLHSLFHAYFANELDFEKFYAKTDRASAFQELKSHFSQEGEVKVNETHILRNIKSSETFSEYNVILVSMESMSAAFLGVFGNPDGNTPSLDRLAREGLLFKNIFATGTRTVRGLEALMLSFPPTPGQSIVRRPNNEHLYSLGSIFKEAGYKTEFLYGGYAYFDNMGKFFSGNEMEVWDQSAIKNSEVTFSNAWGVCDEDLYELSLRRADAMAEQKRPFFQIIMTTSNHRPYTYPQKIDIPSGDGRGGAIRYSDYAIGQFIEKAKSKNWFHETLFIFVADHDASVAGYTKVPVRDFRIPLIFYMPATLAPKVISKLGSQIDVGPTILGLLHATYDSHFFGHDLLRPGEERALLGNYQSVGLLKDNVLTLLSPNRRIEQYQVDDSNDEQRLLPSIRDDLLRETISYYQTAGALFSGGHMQRHDKSKSD